MSSPSLPRRSRMRALSVRAREVAGEAGTQLGAGVRILTHPILPADLLSSVAPGQSRRYVGGKITRSAPDGSGGRSITITLAGHWGGHSPGQYVELGVELGGVWERRSYSIVGPSERTREIRISVRAQGRVSDALCAAPVGTRVRASQARGELELRAGKLLTITGGSGITPVAGLLASLESCGDLRDVVVVHSVRERAELMCADVLAAAAARGVRVEVVESSQQGRLSRELLEGLVPDWAERETWVCGPGGLAGAVSSWYEERGARGRLQQESFTPPPLPVAGSGGSVVLAGQELAVAAGTTLLQAGEAAGISMPSGCRMGICHSCVLPRRSGFVQDLRTGEVHAPQMVQTCISAPAGELVLEG